MSWKKSFIHITRHSLDHKLTASLSHAHRHTRAYGLMQLMETAYHTDSHTNTNVSSGALSAVVRVVLLHIVGWEEANLSKQEHHRSDTDSYFKTVTPLILMCACYQLLTRPYTSPFHQPLWPFLERILMVSPSRSDSSERSLAEKSYLALATPKLLMLPPVRQNAKIKELIIFCYTDDHIYVNIKTAGYKTTFWSSAASHFLSAFFLTIVFDSSVSEDETYWPS